MHGQGFSPSLPLLFIDVSNTAPPQVTAGFTVGGLFNLGPDGPQHGTKPSFPANQR